MSRDLASGDYLDAGTAANLAQTHAMTIAALVNADAITAANQGLVSRYATLSNGWELLIQATTGNLYYRLAESDDAVATATTALTAGTWYGVAAVVSGVDGAGNVHFMRYTAATGATVTEEKSFFNAPSATGTFKAVIGGAWDGSALQRPYAGLIARVGVWAGVSLSDADLLNWFRYLSAPTGGDGLWTLAGTASPEPDASGNGYDLTLSGTTQGADPPIFIPYTRPVRPRPLI